MFKNNKIVISIFCILLICVTIFLFLTKQNDYKIDILIDEKFNDFKPLKYERESNSIFYTLAMSSKMGIDYKIELDDNFDNEKDIIVTVDKGMVFSNIEEGFLKSITTKDGKFVYNSLVFNDDDYDIIEKDIIEIKAFLKDDTEVKRYIEVNYAGNERYTSRLVYKSEDNTSYYYPDINKTKKIKKLSSFTAQEVIFDYLDNVYQNNKKEIIGIDKWNDNELNYLIKADGELLYFETKKIKFSDYNLFCITDIKKYEYLKKYLDEFNSEEYIFDEASEEIVKLYIENEIKDTDYEVLSSDSFENKANFIVEVKGDEDKFHFYNLRKVKINDKYIWLRLIP